MSKVNFLLPMKGHSERVPNKNLKTFVNKPLYHFILEEILKSKYFENVYINTDSENIITDVNKFFPGVNIIDRPENIVGDSVSMNKIIEYDLSLINGEIFLQTHSTNPLLTVDTIDKGIEAFFNYRKKYDSIFSVTKWQSRFYWEDGKPINHNPEELLCTQDLPPMFEENSNFYIFTKESFKAAGNKRIGLNPLMFEIDPMQAVDIDTEFNFLLAEQIYKTFRK